MRKLIKGKNEDFVPFFNASLGKDRTLILQEGGDLSITVDTGFSGTIALPVEILDEMGVEFTDLGVFKLATGDEVELPIFWGKVKIGNSEFETWFVSGEFLLGMEFFSLAGSLLSLDFEKEEVELKK